MENSGLLIIQVFSAEQAYPIAGATVVISKTENNAEKILYTLTTNKNGRTVPVSLAAPPALNSQVPGQNDQFSNYNTNVSFKGYISVENANVAVFSGQTTLQPISLIPLPTNSQSGQSEFIVDQEPEL